MTHKNQQKNNRTYEARQDERGYRQSIVWVPKAYHQQLLAFAKDLRALWRKNNGKDATT